ncbi:Demethylsterigmatocystin 6-O-methyltransferase [Daldinia childiae]|uniref:Demethylsterigmatocystin 6-O-methyltransferase n=1 Tax=Daldinia childiae TaxID=326645 RepID=UPI001445CC7B|nr:Demethylsterigmatocystin 6-O-methyltransferase [Daldinia childiae]KAF3061295.1 Demethylsterigmatocystin 6-O-methyltransferase [Daldinia childiae]
MASVDSSRINTLIGNLSSLSPKLSEGDEDARKQALLLTRKLAASIEKPENLAIELSYAPFYSVFTRVAVDLNIFKIIADHDGPTTSLELAALTGADEIMLVRILRLISSLGFVEEVGERTWIATPITKVMAKEEIAATHRMVHDCLVQPIVKAPKYFKEAGYKFPTDPKDGLIQYAYQTKLSSFDLLSSIPQLLHDFNLSMGNTMGDRKFWFDWFPVKEELVSGAGLTKNSVLLIDIGGGKGHDLISFHERFPHVEGRLILQDSAPVITNIRDMIPVIEPMTYNFFTEQPIKGARAYFYHHILHDWSDEQCLLILKPVKEAMKPGYSKLILHDSIVPEQGASSYQGMLDLGMMAFNGGLERSERQWRELLEKAGFDIVKVWLPPQYDADGIIEAMLKA